MNQKVFYEPKNVLFFFVYLASLRFYKNVATKIKYNTYILLKSL